MKKIIILLSLISFILNHDLNGQCTTETGGIVCPSTPSFTSKGNKIVKYAWDSLKITSNSTFGLVDSNATTDYMIVEVLTKSHQNVQVWAKHSNWQQTKYNYNNYTFSGQAGNEDVTYAGYKNGITISILGDSCMAITDTFYVYFRKICEYANKSSSLNAGKQEWVGEVFKEVPGNNARFWGNTYNQALNFTMDLGTGVPTYSNSCPTCSASSNVDSFKLVFYMDTNFTRGFYKVICNTPNNLEVWTGGSNRIFSHLSDGRSFPVKRTIALLIPSSETAGLPNLNACNAPGKLTYTLKKDTGNLKADISFCRMDGDYSWGLNRWNAYVFEKNNTNWEREVYQGWFETDTDNFAYNWGTGQPSIRQQSCGVSMGDSNFTVRFLMKKTFLIGKYKIRVRSGAGGGTMLTNLNGGPTYYVYNTADYNVGGYDITSPYLNLSGDTGIIIALYKINGNTSRISFVSCREPKNPGNITTSRDTACVGGQVTLAVDTADGTETQWFKKACGGAGGLYIGSGASITVTMDTSTTFYVRNRNLAVAGSDTLNKLDLYSPNCSSKRIIVVAVPAAPSTPVAQNACDNTSHIFTFSSVSAGSGGNQIQWALTSNFSGNHQQSTGTNIIDTVALGKKDTIWIRSYSSSGGCFSSAVNTFAQNWHQPDAPIYPLGSVNCYDTSYTIRFDSVKAGSYGNRTIWALNSALTDSHSLGALSYGVEITGIVGQADTIWWRSVSDTSGCRSNATYTTEVWRRCLPLNATLTPLGYKPDCQMVVLDTLKLAITGGTPPYTYIWRINQYNPQTQIMESQILTRTDDYSGLDYVFDNKLGDYRVTVYDQSGDTVTAQLRIGENIEWAKLKGFRNDSSNSLILDTGSGSFGGYAKGLNTLPALMLGWEQFTIAAGDTFWGEIALCNSSQFNSATQGLEVFVKDTQFLIYKAGSIDPIYAIPYIPGSGYTIKLEVEHDSIRVMINNEVYKFYQLVTSDLFPVVRTDGPRTIPFKKLRLSDIKTSFGCWLLSCNLERIDASSIFGSGTVHALARGGKPPYSYLWSNGDTTSVITNVLPGGYVVTVTDQLGQTATSGCEVQTYVQWLGQMNYSELPNHSIKQSVFQSPTVGITLGGNLLAPDSVGRTVFNLVGGEFSSGILGLTISDFSLVDINPSEGVYLEILPDGEQSFSLQMLLPNNDPLYLARIDPFEDVELLIEKERDTFNVYKNGVIVGSALYAYDTPLFPFVKHYADTFSLIRSVTCNYGIPLAADINIANQSCDSSSVEPTRLSVLGGKPPYRYKWSNGDTTDAIAAALFTRYNATVTDANMDSVIVSGRPEHSAEWLNYSGLEIADDQFLVTGDPEFGRALGRNIIYPRYQSGSMFLHMAPGDLDYAIYGLSDINNAQQLFSDESIGSTSILLGVVGGRLLFGSSQEPDITGVSKLDLMHSNDIELRVIKSDSFKLFLNDSLIKEGQIRLPDYLRPFAVGFINGSLLASPTLTFCDQFKDTFFVAKEVVHCGNNHLGGIYLHPYGGTMPYSYVWNDLSGISYPEQDSVIKTLIQLGIDTTYLSSQNVFNSSAINSHIRSGIDTGQYTYDVYDANGHHISGDVGIGHLSKFAILTDSLQNNGGVISKSSGDSWINNVCVSIIPLGSYDGGYFEYQIESVADFDMGYRDLDLDLLSDSLQSFNSFTYKSDEYHYLSIRNGLINYHSSDGNSEDNIAELTRGDRVAMNIQKDSIKLYKNDQLILQRNKNTGSESLFNIVRIYNRDGSFRILNNVVY